MKKTDLKFLFVALDVGEDAIVIMGSRLVVNKLVFQ